MVLLDPEDRFPIKGDTIQTSGNPQRGLHGKEKQLTVVIADITRVGCTSSFTFMSVDRRNSTLRGVLNGIGRADSPCMSTLLRQAAARRGADRHSRSASAMLPNSQDLRIAPVNAVANQREFRSICAVTISEIPEVNIRLMFDRGRALGDRQLNEQFSS